jgi:hypothetical protein
VKDALEFRGFTGASDARLSGVAVYVGVAFGDEDAVAIVAREPVAALVIACAPTARNAATTVALLTGKALQVGRTFRHINADAALAGLTGVAVEEVAALGSLVAIPEVALFAVRAIRIEFAFGIRQRSAGARVARLACPAVEVVYTAIRFLTDPADASQSERAGVVRLARNPRPADASRALPVRFAVRVFFARGGLTGAKVAALSNRTFVVGGTIRNGPASAARPAECARRTVVVASTRCPHFAETIVAERTGWAVDVLDAINVLHALASTDRAVFATWTVVICGALGLLYAAGVHALETGRTVEVADASLVDADAADAAQPLVAVCLIETVRK